MSVGSYIAALLASEKLGGQVTCHRLLPASEARYAPTRLPWPAAISRTLEQREHLWPLLAIRSCPQTISAGGYSIVRCNAKMEE